MKRIFATALLALACIVALIPAFAEITQQFRDQVMQCAQSLTFSSSALHEELRMTGFLDNARTDEIVERSPPAYALAWAALQAERKRSGAAMELLQNVAQGIAAHHADAIRYAPALRTYFSQFPPDAPVPAPVARRFEFDRTVGATPDVAARLPAAARRLLEPLSSYSGLHPGGMHGLMVDVLGLSPTVAMDIEQSSSDTSDALMTGIAHSSIPPSPEQHLRDVVVALALHGGVSFRKEAVVQMFGGRQVTLNDDKGPPPLVAAHEASRKPASADAMREHAEILALADRIIDNMRNNRDQPPPHVSTGNGGPNNGGPGGGANPALRRGSTPPPKPGPPPGYKLVAQQLHSDGVNPVALPDFAGMRSAGGGLGGGGIIMGSPVTSSIAGQPLAMSFRTIEHSDRVVPVVAMSNGRVLFGSPVRPDVLLAAQRLAFGDRERKVEPLAANGSTGAILISLLVSLEYPVQAAEFLVNPAISDLNIGRDLVVVDGAGFLFRRQLADRVDVASVMPPPTNATVLTMQQWCAALIKHQFGGWYRFAERPSLISTKGDVIEVAAQSGASRTVMFEFLRPSDTKGTNNAPERSVVISDAPDKLPEFAALNDLLKTAAILRWGASAGAKWIRADIGATRLDNVRTVVLRDQTVSFDPRGAMDIELEQVRVQLTTAMKAIAKDRLADAKTLNNAIVLQRKRYLTLKELQARGYSDAIIEQAMHNAAMSEALGNSDPVFTTMLGMLRKDMSQDAFRKLPSSHDCDNPESSICDKSFGTVRRQFDQTDPWARGLLNAGFVQ
ncbi:hypothetical protein ACFQ3P_25885 [Paraburkholderia sabiae]|uniref:Uncharacterized protein n=1 Tax=Paraburkholderia sabiae TaxID=273251 RepID=A0ABU9QL84_9BURK|nr:hypothetical protein [Paraburkholderia sabiae]WJZ77341.1 hypothetical protein QEN71_35315 [Paraburkholderia sabiae]CAD6547755.1 hypothetical protein LMG24235_04477 [Paraburkholderia sabiae]